MNHDQFLTTLEPIAISYLKCKSKELMLRLKEIKQVLLYPDNDTPIVESIEKLVNDIPIE